MAKSKHQSLIKGIANHSRTEDDYMPILLDTVSLEDWRDVVSSTLAASKQGDAQARAWLAYYLVLVGKPAGKASTPLTVVVQQLNGDNPLVNRLSKTVIDQHKYPALHEDDAWENQIKAIIAAGLAEKIPVLKSISNPKQARLSENLDTTQNG